MQNRGFWRLERGKNRKTLKFCRFHLKLKNFTPWGWMACQTVRAAQRRSTTGGQITAVISDTIKGNYWTDLRMLSCTHLRKLQMSGEWFSASFVHSIAIYCQDAPCTKREACFWRADRNNLVTMTERFARLSGQNDQVAHTRNPIQPWCNPQ